MDGYDGAIILDILNLISRATIRLQHYFISPRKTFIRATISRGAYPCHCRPRSRAQGGACRSSIRLSFCQLRLATERPKYVLKNRSSKRGTRGSSIHHQLDRVDVRGIVRREEEHGFGNFFRLAPTALRNRRREELRQLSGIFRGSIGAGPALPNGSFDRAWCDDVHANVARCKVGGDGTRHRDETALGGCICCDERLAEIVKYRPTKDDAAIVVQQRGR